MIMTKNSSCNSQQIIYYEIYFVESTRNTGGLGLKSSENFGFRQNPNKKCQKCPQSGSLIINDFMRPALRSRSDSIDVVLNCEFPFEDRDQIPRS